MQDFFDKFKSSDKKTNNDKPNNKDKKNDNNPIGQFFQGLGGKNNSNKAFTGEGKTLANSNNNATTNNNYKIISIILNDAGPLGIQVERRKHNNTSIVHTVIANSQAEVAGIQTGDLICVSTTNGAEEMIYETFLSISKSRPVCFDVKRINTVSNKKSKDTTPPPPTLTNNMSAEEYHRKQVMIAAAEAREKKYKQQTGQTTTNKKNIATAKLLSNPINNDTTITMDPQSIESKMAMELVKEQEKKNIQQLGYNPYEVKNMTSEQARNAVTVTTHGTIQANDNNHTIPTITPPQSIPSSTTTTSNTTNNNETSSMEQEHQPSIEFENAYEILITSNHETNVNNTISILYKLISNATTKTDIKFRKVRLQNPKIQSSIVEVNGAIDLLLSIGFILIADDIIIDEMILYYPDNIKSPPVWLQNALHRMQQYSQS